MSTTIIQTWKASIESYQESFLMSRGYVLIVGNIAPDNVSAYEDWYVHPKYIKEKYFKIDVR